MNFIKILILIVSFTGAIAGSSQAPDPFVSKVNEAWVNRQYQNIVTLLDERLHSDPNDLGALYTSRTFYLLVKPDKSKALAAVQKIKQVADSLDDSMLSSLGSELLKEVEDIPASEFGLLGQAWLDSMHNEFSSEFPLMSFGIRLRMVQQ